MYYNPYQYGYGGIGYVSTPEGQSPSRSAPAAPVASSRGAIDPDGVAGGQQGPTGTNEGPPGIPQGTFASMLGSALGSPLGGLGSGIGTALGGLAGGMSSQGAIGRGIGTALGGALFGGPLGMIAGSIFGGLLGDGLAGQNDPPEPNPEIGDEIDGVGGGVTGDLGGAFGSGGHPGETDGTGDDGASSCVVTSQLVASGIWPERNRREYVAYCRKFKHARKLGEAQRRGYRAWGRLLVKAMRRWPAAANAGKWVAEAYQDEIRHRMTGARPTVRGKLVAFALEPVSALIGVFKRN